MYIIILFGFPICEGNSPGWLCVGQGAAGCRVTSSLLGCYTTPAKLECYGAAPYATPVLAGCERHLGKRLGGAQGKSEIVTSKHLWQSFGGRDIRNLVVEYCWIKMFKCQFVHAIFFIHSAMLTRCLTSNFLSINAELMIKTNMSYNQDDLRTMLHSIMFFIYFYNELSWN